MGSLLERWKSSVVPDEDGGGQRLVCCSTGCKRVKHTFQVLDKNVD